MPRAVHTVHQDGLWVNELEGGGELSRHQTKAEAVTRGRSEARQRQVEHVIHNMDGSIADRQSYGDPPGA
jgi:hypothetical protein